MPVPPPGLGLKQEGPPTLEGESAPDSRATSLGFRAWSAQDFSEDDAATVMRWYTDSMPSLGWSAQAPPTKGDWYERQKWEGQGGTDVVINTLVSSDKVTGDPPFVLFIAMCPPAPAPFCKL